MLHFTTTEMPRFPDEATACLKRTMLARAPRFRFTTEDVESIVAETGLITLQVNRWEDHFQRRKTEQNRMMFLQSKVMCINKRAKFARGCVLGFNLHVSDVEKFKMLYPKKVCSIEAAINTHAGSFEIFIAFPNNAPEYEYKFIAMLEGLGAGQVQLITFPNDQNKTASTALERIIKLQKTEFFGAYSFGVPSLHLTTKIKNKDMKNTAKRLCNFCPEPETDEFDVVKKRRKIDAASPSADDSETAMEHFAAFESATLPALMLTIDADDRHTRYNELLEMEDQEIPTTAGGVYIAFTNSMPDVVKIGATRRPAAFPRLRELSRYVTEAYQLLVWLPASKPFKLEVQLHKHFDTLRIKNQGAGTEFFRMAHNDARIQDMLQTLRLSHHGAASEQRD